MNTKVDIATMTSTQLRELKANELDRKWKEQYPDGMYYIIWHKSGGISLGRNTRRPTSRTGAVEWYSDAYNVLSYALKKIKKFADKEAFIAAAKKLGLTKHPYILYLETGDVLTGQHDLHGKELRAYDKLTTAPGGIYIIAYHRETDSYGFWDNGRWHGDLTLGEYKSSKYGREGEDILSYTKFTIKSATK